MKKTSKSLKLRISTLRPLTPEELSAAPGAIGFTLNGCSYSGCTISADVEGGCCITQHCQTIANTCDCG